MAVMTDIQRWALRGAGSVARYVPHDRAQIFSFIASPKVRARPWHLYQRLHRKGGVREVYPGVWIVATHELARGVLRNPRLSVNEDNATVFPPSTKELGAFSEMIGRSLLFVDPPDHERLRRLVSRAFTPRRIAELRPKVEALVADRIAALRPRGSADLLREVTYPVPVAVISEMLGVPEEDHSRFIRWAHDLAPRLDVSPFRDEEVERRGDEAAVELGAYLEGLIDDPSRRSPDGLLTALVDAESEGDTLTRAEVVSSSALMLLAGYETTANLVANSLVALFDHPTELARLRAGEVGTATAVDELLRHAGPVQFAQRVVMEPLELGGHALQPGVALAILVGAANRDPLVFPDPDRLDLGRDPNPHLSFSTGIHS
jgi:cytochrome P450